MTTIYKYTAFSRAHDDELDRGPCATRGDLATLIAQLLGLAFFCCTVYALASAAVPSVRDACGVNLWTFVLVHLLLYVALACVLVCIAVAVEERRALAVMATLVCVAHLTLLIVGSIFVHHALSDAPCRGALSRVSFGQDPMLVIVAIIYLVLDGLVALTFCCALPLVGCVMLFRA